MKSALVCGAGGFIGGHLVSNLTKDKNGEVVCADIKPKKFWFQINEKTHGSVLTFSSKEVYDSIKAEMDEHRST